jgi:7-carboxy-7-deazaguanine synthase
MTPREKARPDTLRVNEIFYSIQGESSRAGERCIFVRLTGCGLRCTYCDTEYAFYEGKDMLVEDVLEQIKGYGAKLVELTGGEPLEQDAVYPLMSSLLSKGYSLMVETGGHIDISRVDKRVKRIVDLKTPSSGMVKKNKSENIRQLTRNDEVKFVIGTREDYEWSRDKVLANALDRMAGLVLFSPVHGTIDPKLLADWILADQLDVRLQVQLHKVLWPATMRGV